MFGLLNLQDTETTRRRRRERLEYDNYRCVDCGSDGSDSRLEVHHLTYDRLGFERLTDLQTLCHFCHCLEHGRGATIGVPPIAGREHELERARQAYERDDAMRRSRAATRKHSKRHRYAA